MCKKNLKIALGEDKSNCSSNEALRSRSSSSRNPVMAFMDQKSEEINVDYSGKSNSSKNSPKGKKAGSVVEHIGVSYSHTNLQVKSITEFSCSARTDSSHAHPSNQVLRMVFESTSNSNHANVKQFEMLKHKTDSKEEQIWRSGTKVSSSGDSPLEVEMNMMESTSEGAAKQAQLEEKVEDFYKKRKDRIQEKVEDPLCNFPLDLRPEMTKYDLYLVGLDFGSNEEGMYEEMRNRALFVHPDSKMFKSGYTTRQFVKPLPTKLKVRIDGATKVDPAFGYSLWNHTHEVEFGGGKIQDSFCMSKESRHIEIAAGCLTIKTIHSRINSGKINILGINEIILEFDSVEAVKAFSSGIVLNSPQLQREVKEALKMIKSVCLSFEWVPRQVNRLPHLIAEHYSKNNPEKARTEILESKQREQILREDEVGKRMIIRPRKTGRRNDVKKNYC